MKTIATGSLNDLNLYISNFKFLNKSTQAYEMLEQTLKEEGVEWGEESWCDFIVSSDNVQYAICGNGELTSGGEYIYAELEESERFDISYEEIEESGC